MINYVLPYGYKELSTVCVPVLVTSEEDKEHLATLVSNLKDTMCAHRALGVAAPQIGVVVRAFVIRKDPEDVLDENNYQFVMNPQILEFTSELVAEEEGCLSFRGISVRVERPTTINVHYLNEDGEPVQEWMVGLKARSFLHEFDHLNGKTFLDRVGNVTKKLALRQLGKKQKMFKRYADMVNSQTVNQ